MPGHVLILFVFATLLYHGHSTDSDDCEGGSLYEYFETIYVRRQIIENSWYLNIQYPMTCSGFVSEIKMHYYSDLNQALDNCFHIAMFEPLAPTSDNRQFTMVPESLRVICHSTTSKSEGRLTIPYSPSSQYAVKKGSVVGIHHSSPTEETGLRVISRIESEDEESSGERTLCRTGELISSPNQTTSITCNVPLNLRQLLRVEVSIDSIDCSRPINPINGVIEYDSYLDHSYGGVITYSCNYNYYLSGNTNRTCLSTGEWTGSDPACLLSASQCPALSDPEHGEISYTNGVLVDTVASCECHDGYYLHEPWSATCLISGEWSNPSPSCVPITCPLLPKRTGLAHNPHYIYGYIYGDIVVFSCTDAGTRLTGSSVILCNDKGAWNDSFPYCITQNNILPINNGYSNPSSYQPATQSQQTILPTTALSSASNDNAGKYTTINSLMPSLVVSTTSLSYQSQASVRVSISSTVLQSRQVNSSNSAVTDEEPQPWFLKLDLRTFVIIVGAIVMGLVAFVAGMMCFCIWYTRRCAKERKMKKKFKNNGQADLRYPVDVNTMERNATLPEAFYETPCNRYDYLTPCQDTSVYEEPAREEFQLYIQLNRIKVKKIQREDLHLIGPLGSGQFGNVYYSVWSCNNERKNVAIKTLQNAPSDKDKVKFLQEAAIMGQFQHKNVLTLYGIVQDKIDDEILLVVELMVKGDLKNYLKQKLSKKVSNSTPLLLLEFCRQICNGMCYLSSKGYVHRDLAARNILVSRDYTCKISDFGMSRDLEDGYYLAQRGGVIPFKWTAPEAINFRKYSTSSDVWSYGCVLYEIWSLGCRPFDDIDSRKVLLKLERGYRLPPPPGCPKVIYELMIDTWHPEPKERPSFSTIMIDYLLQENDDLLLIPNTDRQTHPQAGILNAGDIAAGHNMYKNIQNRYSYYFTIDQ